MKITPTIHQTTAQIKRAKLEDRLEIALLWIQNCVNTISERQDLMTGPQLRNYMAVGYKQWKSLVAKEIPFIEAGEEWILEDEHFPEYFADFLRELPSDGVQAAKLEEALADIFEYFGWDTTLLSEMV